jgi:8-oxo-dGTP pyrophosphatase MutT (NUDIX family)
MTIDKLAWVHLREGRLLCARSRGKDSWFVPGGKREAGESDAEALVREVREELSVELRRDSIEPLGVFEAQAYGRDAGVNVRLMCYAADYDGELKPAAEIEEIAWLGLDERDEASPATRLVMQWLQENGCSRSSTSSSSSRS